jgi:hypothetical protein
MSKNIELLLKELGVQDIEATKTALLSDEENSDIIVSLKKQAQAYSRPFLEAEFIDKSNTERKSYKGKYMKEALLKANKTFGNALTNKEIDDILNDPENEGKNIDVALDTLKERVSDKKGTPEHELQKMLDVANGKLKEYEEKIPQIEKQAEEKAKQAIEQFKLDGVVTKKLLEVLNDKTDNPNKVAELIKGQLSQKALLRLKEDGNIGLYDLANPDTPLKKNETTLENFESLVTGMVDYYGLTKKSAGTERKPIPTTEPEPPQKITSGLGAKMAQVASA